MARVQKPGFTYGYSEELKLEWAISDRTGTLTTEDGVQYTVAEQNLLYRKYGHIPGNIHAIKKIFKGTLIDPETTSSGPSVRPAIPAPPVVQPVKPQPPQPKQTIQPAANPGLFDIY